MNGMDFLRLQDCANTTRLGFADRGFPKAMGRLEAQGYVKRVVETGQKWPGYKVTELGLAAIRERLQEEQVRYIPPDRWSED